ncbi:hypothetical protein C427_3445 [Paraglaciecola psychrophila 170]|uniref:Uncharacterized protein n=1 Tax=Paraglaciecola psychrophila 170 TaxID=1129794 RepID=K7ANE7_9ALTE|nr:hypothetical protein C427_3445 [Paraglaciecola psychrophila 170]GAC36850.1 hypothetical protein GPSY_1213 [Paraglaciecola psychrophila 170]
MFWGNVAGFFMLRRAATQATEFACLVYRFANKNHQLNTLTSVVKGTLPSEPAIFSQLLRFNFLNITEICLLII